MKPFLFIVFLLGVLSVKGQTTEFHYIKPLTDKERISQLEGKVEFLMRDVMEMRLRLDSLVHEMKAGRVFDVPLKIDSAQLRAWILAAGSDSSLFHPVPDTSRHRYKLTTN